jgi:hypothetical protein
MPDFVLSEFMEALRGTLVIYGWLLPFAGAAFWMGTLLHQLGRRD